MKMLQDLLEKNPYRDIVSVVKVNDHTPEIVWSELEEYVPTEEVKENFRKIIEGFIETKRGYTEEVCVWLSGFFGSGKSHFLKVLGYLLENRELAAFDGGGIQSTSYIATKLGLQNLAPLISKEFRTKVLFLYLLDYDPTVDPTLSRLIYRSLKEEKGLSDKIWVSLWEEEIWREGKYEEFKEWVRKEFEREWEEIRKLRAKIVLKKALTVFLGFSDESEAQKAVEESVRGEIRPSDVVKELKRYAEEIDENKGRVVVLLDEVGLYVGDSTERLTDLNALAEQVVKEGGGKVWLISTSQEALPEMVDRFAMERQKLEWLRDRFRHFSLTPAGVEKVVSERMLKKKVEAIEILKEFYQNKAGVVSEALSLKSAKLPTDINEDDFVTFYPFLPYSIRLLQDISRALVRTVDDARRFSARERSMLKIVHAILRGEGDIDCFAEKELGVFVTFDILYDAISSDLRFIKSDYHAIIEKEIGELGEIEEVEISSVAKALFLLQNIEEMVPCSLDNLSAVLFPDVSTDKNKYREAVKKCLAVLREKGWAVEENGTYRLLTYDENELEKRIRENLPRIGEKRKFLKGVLEEKLKKFEYQHGKSRRPFDVGFTIDGERITEGDLEVVIYTSFPGKKEEEILSDSSNRTNIVYWLAVQDSEFERIVERTVALEKTQSQFRTLTQTEKQRQYIKILGEEYMRNLKGIIPRKIESIFRNGVVYVSGVKSAPLDAFGKTLEERLKPIAEEVYSEFVDARPKRDEECASILNWTPRAKIPSIYTDLGIVMNNAINVSAKITSTVLKQIEYKRSYGLSRTGKDLIAEFEKPSYGWDPRIVRLAVASLFKAGKISVMWNNEEHFSARPEHTNVFVKGSQFNKASFDVLPEVDWRKASELLSSIFGERSEDTFEKTAEKVREVGEEWGSKARQLQTRVIDNELPEKINEEVEVFIKAIVEVTKAEEPNAELRVFLEKERDLKKNFKLIRNLERFDFGKYREIKKFIENPVVSNALGDFEEKMENMRKTNLSEAVIERLSEVAVDYDNLLDEFSRRYEERHGEFNEWTKDALEEVKKHKAFESKIEEAKGKEEELRKYLCKDLNFDSGVLCCKNCKRHFTDMNESRIRGLKQKVLEELDKLMPEPEKKTGTLEIIKELRSEEVEGVIEKIREFFTKYKGIFEVEIKIKPRSR